MLVSFFKNLIKWHHLLLVLPSYRRNGPFQGQCSLTLVSLTLAISAFPMHEIKTFCSYQRNSMNFTVVFKCLLNILHITLSLLQGSNAKPYKPSNFTSLYALSTHHHHLGTLQKPELLYQPKCPLQEHFYQEKCQQFSCQFVLETTFASYTTQDGLSLPAKW